MKYANTFLLAAAIATNTIGIAKLKTKEEQGIICKTITDKECPYCSHERCHDSKHQWDGDLYSCPAVDCVPVHNEKYDPKDWDIK